VETLCLRSDYTIQSVDIDGKVIVVLEIRPSSGRPYGLQLQDKPVEFYVRRGRSTYPATQAEVRALAQPPAQQHGFPGFPLSGAARKGC
jgi:predicted HTH transcriptional regulator